MLALTTITIRVSQHCADGSGTVADATYKFLYVDVGEEGGA